MTEYEYDSMMKFLDQLIHTKTAAKDLTAERRIKQALERQPFAAYFLVQRARSSRLKAHGRRSRNSRARLPWLRRRLSCLTFWVAGKAPGAPTTRPHTFAKRSRHKM